jgi:hypothetical protein
MEFHFFILVTVCFIGQQKHFEVPSDPESGSPFGDKIKARRIVSANKNGDYITFEFNGFCNEVLLPPEVSDPSPDFPGSKPRGKNQYLPVGTVDFIQQQQRLSAITAVMVDRNKQRPEWWYVHENVIHKKPEIPQPFVYIFHQQQGIKTSERMVPCKYEPSRFRNILLPEYFLLNPESLHRRVDKIHRFHMTVPDDEPIDKIEPHNPVNQTENKIWDPSGKCRILLPEYLFDIDGFEFFW